MSGAVSEIEAFFGSVSLPSIIYVQKKVFHVSCFHPIFGFLRFDEEFDSARSGDCVRVGA